MRLTRYTDYALRVLLYLGARPEKLSSIGEISRAYGVSQNHMMKVVSELVRAGYVTSLRGRGGGLRLARPASNIRIGEVVRRMENDFDLVDCANCLIGPVCGLSCLLREATEAFLAKLDEHSLAEALARKEGLALLLRSDMRG